MYFQLSLFWFYQKKTPAAPIFNFTQVYVLLSINFVPHGALVCDAHSATPKDSSRFSNIACYWSHCSECGIREFPNLTALPDVPHPVEYNIFYSILQQRVYYRPRRLDLKKHETAKFDWKLWWIFVVGSFNSGRWQWCRTDKFTYCASSKRKELHFR